MKEDEVGRNEKRKSLEEREGGEFRKDLGVEGEVPKSSWNLHANWDGSSNRND